MVCIDCRKFEHEKCKTWPAYVTATNENSSLKTWCDCKHLPESYSDGPES